MPMRHFTRPCASEISHFYHSVAEITDYWILLTICLTAFLQAPFRKIPLTPQVISIKLVESYFNFEDHIITPIRILQVLGIDPFADARHETWVITIMYRLSNNRGYGVID